MSISVKKKYSQSSKTSPQRDKVIQLNPYNLPQSPKKSKNYSIGSKDQSNSDPFSESSSGKKSNLYNNFNAKAKRVPKGLLLPSNIPQKSQNLDYDIRQNKNISIGTNRLNIPEKHDIDQILPNFEEDKVPLNEEKECREEFKIRTGSSVRNKKSISWNLQNIEKPNFNTKISELEERVQNLEKQNSALVHENLLKDLEIENLEKDFQKFREEKENEFDFLQNKINSLTKNLQISIENNTKLGKTLQENQLMMQELEQNLNDIKVKKREKCFKLKMTLKEMRKTLENSEIVNEIKAFEEIVERKNEDAKMICKLQTENDLLIAERKIGFNGNSNFQNTLKCVSDENSRLRSMIIMSKLFN